MSSLSVGVVNPEKCAHYAAFMSHLDRKHFDALYWALFFVVLFSLFASSWIYQRTMMLRNKPHVEEAALRKKLRVALALSAAIFLATAAICVVEVYALLALQFCDGEDLMSLFWSTWTMLQLGSEIAILGVVLALWHSIVEIRHPVWALALGTPVLVVAGFGHVIQYFCELYWKRAKDRRRQRSVSRSTATLTMEKEPVSPSDTSIKLEEERDEEPMRQTRLLKPQGTHLYFTIDVGKDERIKTWPSFVGMSDGRAVLRLMLMPEASHDDLERAQPSAPAPNGS
ncbi:hypothetical protein DL766_000536 [Monosporascus sp. MC13-8B]|uniref:Uncharacterized protein n=1 Tax=Monosporascus cannonballus TaxID=155416 RepID=A0ABY0GS95_9PEZI|nr:hypothetical protein DL762_009831 [Monosporascus cannonballus]RYO82793.1 hypothetical protein DL763_008107 [Monosporascus cannonballus]RYP39166.1 hypothetical protein DL766_000536 [Monosporascus sp. MC13-8B]